MLNRVSRILNRTSVTVCVCCQNKNHVTFPSSEISFVIVRYLLLKEYMDQASYCL